MSSTPAAPRDEAEVGRRVLTALVAAQKALRFYPPTNPQVRVTLERLTHFLDSTLSSAPLVLAVLREGFAAGEAPVTASEGSITRLAFKLHCLNVAELTLAPGFGGDELVAFLRFLNQPFETLRNQGPIDASLAAHGVRHVAVRLAEAVVPVGSDELATIEAPAPAPMLRRARSILVLLEEPGQFARELVRQCVEVVPAPGQRRLDAQLAFVDRFLQATAAAIEGQAAEHRPALYEQLSRALEAICRGADVSGARLGGLPLVDLTQVDPRVLQVLPERDLVKEVSSKVKLHQGATTVMASSLRQFRITSSAEHTNPVIKVIETHSETAQSVASNIQVLDEIRAGQDVDGEYPGIAYAERDRDKNFTLPGNLVAADIGTEERHSAQAWVAELNDWRPSVDAIDTVLDMLFNEKNPNFTRLIADRLVDKLSEFLDRGDLDPALAILRGFNVERRRRRDDPANLQVVESAITRAEQPERLARLLRHADTLPLESEAFEKVKAFFFLLDKPVVHALVELVTTEGGRYSRRRIGAIVQYLCRNRLEILAEGLQAARPEAARIYVWLLGHFGREALPSLRRAAHHPEPRVRREAARGLAQIDGEEAPRILASLLGDRDEAVVATVLRALLKRGARDAAPAIEAALLNEGFLERSEEVALLLVRAAQQLGSTSTAATLRRVEERGRLRRLLRAPALREALRAAIRQLEERGDAG